VTEHGAITSSAYSTDDKVLAAAVWLESFARGPSARGILAAMTTRARRTTRTAVYLESGSKRVFACAVDWPGWCRSGKTEEAALETLAAYAPRYTVVADQAGISFPASLADALDVVERLSGSATTDFGAPGEVPTVDAAHTVESEAERLAAIVVASWAVFDRVAANASIELRKGPRGGGRDRDKIVQHVLGAEASYARKFGVRHREPSMDDEAAIWALRGAITEVLRRPSDGSPLAPKGWPQRYAARRVAWHVLDHAWEIEDRSTP